MDSGRPTTNISASESTCSNAEKREEEKERKLREEQARGESAFGGLGDPEVLDRDASFALFSDKRKHSVVMTSINAFQDLAGIGNSRTTMADVGGAINPAAAPLGTS